MLLDKGASTNQKNFKWGGGGLAVDVMAKYFLVLNKLMPNFKSKHLWNTSLLHQLKTDIFQESILAPHIYVHIVPLTGVFCQKNVCIQMTGKIQGASCS